MLEAVVAEESKAAVVEAKVKAQLIVNVFNAVSRATWQRTAGARRKDHKEVVVHKWRKAIKAAAAEEAAAEGKEQQLKQENV